MTSSSGREKVKFLVVILDRAMNNNLACFPGGGRVLPYMGYIGMCCCEGYGFQAVYSRIGYINLSVCV